MAINVLVVDDSEIMRKMIKRAVGMSGLPIAVVREAGDGLAALEALNEASADLVLLDVNMPRLDGLETLRRMRQNACLRSVPVVIVSTEGSDQRIAEVRSHGAAFVRKPFSPEQLVDAVIDAIGESHGSVQDSPVACDGPDF